MIRPLLVTLSAVILCVGVKTRATPCSHQLSHNTVLERDWGNEAASYFCLPCVLQEFATPTSPCAGERAQQAVLGAHNVAALAAGLLLLQRVVMVVVVVPVSGICLLLMVLYCVILGV